MTRGGDIRIDLQLIADMVAPKSRLLDIGCGDGTLLQYLAHFKQVDGRGIELSMAGVNTCVKAGLAVIQGDADTDLNDYPEHGFDYVVLSQTLQATHRPREVLENLVRIGRHAIVSFPNFGHWKVRARLAFQGAMPVTRALPETWYETPNIHMCTIRDFVMLAARLGLKVETGLALDGNGQPLNFAATSRRANLCAEQAIFMLSRPER